MANISINGYSIDLDAMKSSTSGTIGVAKKNGTKYFCKRINKPVEPCDNGALSPKAMEANQALFNDFKRRKTRLNTVLRGVAGIGGNIVYPLEEVVYDHHWTEFYEYIEDAVPEGDYAKIIAGLSDKEKQMVLKVAIGALQTLHSQHIVHADLKLTNIMLVRKSSGTYASKIIDFDGAFFEDDVPLDSITGTVNYYSPELAIYSGNEDPGFREKFRSMITTKSDIFTMGIVLHEYLTGAKPEPDGLPSQLQKRKAAGKFVYPWEVLLTHDEGKQPHQLVISDKINEPAYVALISDMLCLEPERRPSAAEVLKRLNSKELPIETDVWPEHRITIQPERLEGKVIGLRKFEQAKESDVLHLYEIIEADGRRFVKSADELITAGLAQRAESWTSPRPEDAIEWNIEKLKRAYVSVEPAEEAGIYRLYDKSGSLRRMPCSTLKMLGFARSIGGRTAARAKTAAVATVIIPPKKAELRAEDASRYRLNEDILAKQHMRFLGPVTLNEKPGYQFELQGGSKRCLNVETCKTLRFLIPVR